MTRHNMAAQPRKSSPRRKSSNDEKMPGYPLQQQGCVFESLSQSQPDPVLLTYCTVNVEIKPIKNYFKKYDAAVLNSSDLFIGNPLTHMTLFSPVRLLIILSKFLSHLSHLSYLIKVHMSIFLSSRILYRMPGHGQSGSSDNF